MISKSTLPKSISVELTPQLITLRDKYLGSEIAELISQETPKEVILNRKGRGGNYDYVPVYWFVNRLNALFGYLWDVVVDDKGFVEEDTDVEDFSLIDPNAVRKFGARDKLPTKTVKMITQVWVHGHLTVNVPGYNERITRPDGSVTEHKVEPISITKHAFGGVEVKYFKEGGIIDLADDYKAAEADLLKKAASYLGICWDVYGSREVKRETGPRESQLIALYKKAAHLDTNPDIVKEKVGKLCEAQFKVSVDELDTETFLKLIKLVAPKPSFAKPGILIFTK